MCSQKEKEITRRARGSQETKSWVSDSTGLGCNRKLVCPNWPRGFPAGSVVKNLPAVQETWVWSLGQEDPLEEEMAAYSSILAWRIPQTKEPGRLQSMGSQSQTQLSTAGHFGCHSLGKQVLPTEVRDAAKHPVGSPTAKSILNQHVSNIEAENIRKIQ